MSVLNGSNVHALAGQPAPPELLVNVPRLIAAYYTERPDPSIAGHRVVFGTSGHRGSSLTTSFNEAHILAITQAICLYGKAHAIEGPLFVGWDTHALSEPARVTVLEVLAANGVDVMVDARDDVTPTPMVSRAIGADPLGGASIRDWEAAAERYDVRLSVVNPAVDPTFRFLTVDWDGAIRMDPSSPYAMARLNPNHDLAVAIGYLFSSTACATARSGSQARRARARRSSAATAPSGRRTRTASSWGSWPQR